MDKGKNRKNKRKLITRGHGNEPTVIEFNLSKAVILCIAIGVIIATITTVTVITTIMDAKQNNTLAETESNEKVTYVESTTIGEDGTVTVDKDENGETITVPVPKGYSASKIPGETSANHGFVIYEGDVDWDSILVGEEVETQTNSIEADIEETIETTDNANVTEENSEQKDENDVESNEEQLPTTEPEIVENIEEVQGVEETQEITENKETIDEAQIEEENNAIDTLANDETANGEVSANAETGEITQEDINIFNLQKSVNQYVWVPVKDISRIYGVDSNGKLWGKLWDFPSSATGSRTARNWTETDGIMEISSKTSWREPDVLCTYLEYDVDSYLQAYLDGKSQAELLSKELEENFLITIKSIQEYGGFYIGRYETGGLNKEAVVRKMDTNLGSQTWYSMYEKTQKLKGNNENIETLMIWGSLWDETLQWLVDSGATTSTGIQLTYEQLDDDSSDWGNYEISSFYYIPSGSETPDATEFKDEGSSNSKIIPAGSSEYTKVNNIYDLAGNVYDRTLEVYNTTDRVHRGGSYSKRLYYYDPATSRISYYDGPSMRYGTFRVSCSTFD